MYRANDKPLMVHHHSEQRPNHGHNIGENNSLKRDGYAKEAELRGELIAWCYRLLGILHGEKPIDVAKTPEGKKKLIALLQSVETDVKKKKTKRPNRILVDYTIIKTELGLL